MIAPILATPHAEPTEHQQLPAIQSLESISLFAKIKAVFSSIIQVLFGHFFTKNSPPPVGRNFSEAERSELKAKFLEKFGKIPVRLQSSESVESPILARKLALYVQETPHKSC